METKLRLFYNNPAWRRRGSLAVEAAIFLPLFIVGILTLGCLIKFAMAEEGVSHALADESRKAAAWASVNPYPFAFTGDVEERVSYEGRGELDEVSVSRFLYRVPGAGASGKLYTDLIGASVSYRMPLRLPHIFRSEILGEETALCRAFVGTDNGGAAMPFSEMEDDQDGQTVWVFPRAGEKYHAETCRYIANDPHEVMLSGKVRRKYHPCELCHPEGRRDGALVYVFPTSGEAYHTGECTVVKRFVIEVGLEDAKKQGYTACSVCGGGAGSGESGGSG